ncbi:hypothetical protein JYU34_021244 [Plutella xylostella]|uniref:Uncharacterized protein n=1 Tax=Plutella xylostella TaxID=51655 RepID=A0ABQ7PUM9_PLUXY|nr:hypothetical protein JYU34_021244 [Plutella xylostella]
MIAYGELLRLSPDLFGHLESVCGGLVYVCLAGGRYVGVLRALHLARNWSGPARGAGGGGGRRAHRPRAFTGGACTS